MSFYSLMGTISGEVDELLAFLAARLSAPDFQSATMLLSKALNKSLSERCSERDGMQAISEF